MAGGLLKDRDELEALFGELANELDDLNVSTQIVMVGGAWMLWHSQRAATRDIDSARKLDPEVGRVVRKIARRHDLGDRWLNDSAVPFWPATARYEDCSVVYRSQGLEVRSPEPEVIFLMKLLRADPQDREDLILLWPICRFGSPDDVARAFWEAYPNAPDDEYLASYVADVAREAANS